MIPTIIKTDSLSQQPASATPVTPVTASKPAQDTLSDLIPGHKYQALIEARLPHGHARVLISDQLLQMQLPQHLKPGKQITLTFVSHEPKLTFLLQDNALLNANQHYTTISTTGRFLGILTQNTTKSNTPQVLTTTPVLPSPPLNSMQIPVLLQQAISQSGLFYEAHQAQWIAGKKDIMQLQQEPQSKLAANLPAMASTGNHTLEPSLPVHTQSLTLVQQQMTILETGILMWKGEIWPDQTMEWQISEHTSEKEDDEALQQWKTQIRLTLPHLGEVTARITMNTYGMQIKLTAAEHETTQILKDNRTPLTNNMASIGLNIQSVNVQQDDKK